MRTRDERLPFCDSGTGSAAAFLVLATVALAGDASAQTWKDDRLPSTEDSLESSVRQLSDSRLKELYLRCNVLAAQRQLDSSEIEICSVDSDTLLARVFQGNFDALLDWARSADARRGHDGRLVE